MDLKMLMLKVQRRDQRQRGQAIVETAIVMLLLLTLTFGVLDMGVYMYRYIQAANCVREFARRTVVNESTADTYCVDAGLTPAVSVSGEEVTATIDTVHNWMVVSYLIPGLGPTAPIDARVTMRMEVQVSP